METIDQQRRQQHVAWIQTHHEKIAAVGNGGFRQRGAGALLIDLDQFRDRAEDEQVLSTVGLKYRPDRRPKCRKWKQTVGQSTGVIVGQSAGLG